MTISRKAIADQLEACRFRDPLRAHRLASILEMLNESDTLRKKAGEALMTLQPADGPTRSERMGVRWRQL